MMVPRKPKPNILLPQRMSCASVVGCGQWVHTINEAGLAGDKSAVREGKASKRGMGRGVAAPRIKSKTKVVTQKNTPATPHTPRLEPPHNSRRVSASTAKASARSRIPKVVSASKFPPRRSTPRFTMIRYQSPCARGASNCHRPRRCAT